MDTTMYALVVTDSGDLKRSIMEHYNDDTWHDHGCTWTGHVVGYQQGKRIWPVVATGGATSWPVTAGMSWYVTLPGSTHEPTEAEEAKERIDWLTEHGYLTFAPSYMDGEIATVKYPESRQ